MICAFSGSCETAGKQPNAGDQEPCFGAGNAGLEVLGEATIASEPGEGAFDDPAFGLGFEGSDLLGASDDLDRPPAELGDRAAKLVATVDAVGEDMLQLGKVAPQRREQRYCAVIVLDIGGVHQQGEQEALRVGDDVALASLDPFGGVKPTRAAAFRGLSAL